MAEELQKRAKKGYQPHKATISHLLYWRDKNQVPETYEQIVAGELVTSTVNPEILVALVEVWLGKV